MELPRRPLDFPFDIELIQNIPDKYGKDLNIGVRGQAIGISDRGDRFTQAVFPTAVLPILVESYRIIDQRYFDWRAECTRIEDEFILICHKGAKNVKIYYDHNRDEVKFNRLEFTFVKADGNYTKCRIEYDKEKATRYLEVFRANGIDVVKEIVYPENYKEPEYKPYKSKKSVPEDAPDKYKI